MAKQKRGKAWRCLPSYIQTTPFQDVLPQYPIETDPTAWQTMRGKWEADCERAVAHRGHCSGMFHAYDRPECQPYDVAGEEDPHATE